MLSVIAGLALAAPAAAESVRKECGQKYQAAKAAGTLNGQAWPQFYSQCAAEAKAAPEAAGTPPAAPPPAVPAAAPPAATAKSAPAVPAAAGSPVFPSAVSAAYSSLKPGRARLKTCADQYRANKATNGNAGLPWNRKGGGAYWSLCNAHLKG